MSRLDIINDYADRRDNEVMRKAEEKIKTIDAFTETVLSMKDRVIELLKVGNACVERGIRISTLWEHKGYETKNFMADGTNHQFGFVTIGYDNNFNLKGVSKIGIDYYKNEYIYTDGENVYFGGNTFQYDHQIKRTENWLKEFEKFEKAFYSYIDSLAKEEV